MLGEAARTAADAARYLTAYDDAIAAIGRSAADRDIGRGAGHFGQAVGAAPALRDGAARSGARANCRRSCSISHARRRQAGIGFTIDAEEADRLELSLDLFEALALAPGPRRLGRARPRRPGLSEARAAGHRLARRSGPARRAAADGAARQGRLLGQRDQARAGARARRLSGLHPQGRDRCLLPRLRAPAARARRAPSIRNSRPTTRIPSRRSSKWPAIAAIGSSSACTAWARRSTTRSSGRSKLDRPCRIYAPVGSHEDLLAYLVRRLLENGANTSFVNRIVDDKQPIDEIIADPIARLARLPVKPHPAHPAAARPLRAGAQESRPGSTSTIRRRWRRCATGSPRRCAGPGKRRRSSAASSRRAPPSRCSTRATAGGRSARSIAAGPADVDRALARAVARRAVLGPHPGRRAGRDARSARPISTRAAWRS